MGDVVQNSKKLFELCSQLRTFNLCSFYITDFAGMHQGLGAGEVLQAAAPRRNYQVYPDDIEERGACETKTDHWSF